MPGIYIPGSIEVTFPVSKISQPDEGGEVGHADGHGDENGGQAREGDEAHHGHEHHVHDQQKEGVEHAGKGALGAVSDARGGSGDGSGGGQAPGQGGGDVGNPLAHQLLVGVVLSPGHAVGHGGGEQTFNGAEKGDDDGGQDQLARDDGGKAAEVHARKLRADLPIGGADGGNARLAPGEGVQGQSDQSGDEDGAEGGGEPFA